MRSASARARNARNARECKIPRPNNYVFPVPGRGGVQHGVASLYRGVEAAGLQQVAAAEKRQALGGTRKRLQILGLALAADAGTGRPRRSSVSGRRRRWAEGFAAACQACEGRRREGEGSGEARGAAPHAYLRVVACTV